MSHDSLPPAGPGRPKDLAKREAILTAAKKLFVHNGYGASSMEAIAAEAGVSKLTVYSHFTDKETLFVAAVQSKCEEQLPPLFFQFNANTPIRSALLTIGTGFHSLITSEEALALHRLMLAQSAHNPSLSQQFYNAGPLRVTNAMEQLLQQAHTSGQLKVSNPRAAAGHFLCMIQGSHHLRLLAGIESPMDKLAAERHVQDVVELFLRAFRMD